jgi:hypothetical protein
MLSPIQFLEASKSDPWPPWCFAKNQGLFNSELNFLIRKKLPEANGSNLSQKRSPPGVAPVLPVRWAVPVVPAVPAVPAQHLVVLETREEKHSAIHTCWGPGGLLTWLFLIPHLLQVTKWLDHLLTSVYHHSAGKIQLLAAKKMPCGCLTFTNATKHKHQGCWFKPTKMFQSF